MYNCFVVKVQAKGLRTKRNDSLLHEELPVLTFALLSFPYDETVKALNVNKH